jgi:hypothetical protein
MPFKSQAQRRKFAQLLVEGKISPETFEEWNRETGSRNLPERATTHSTKRKRVDKKGKDVLKAKRRQGAPAKQKSVERDGLWHS